MYSYTSVEILQRLIGRFDLQSYPIDPNKAFVIPHYIQPVTDVDRLLRTTKIYEKSSSVTGNGNVTLFTCPVGKKWEVVSVEVDKQAGDYNIDTLKLRDLSATGVVIMVLATMTDDDLLRTFEQPIPMEEGDTLLMSVSSYVGTGAYVAYILVWEEDAF